MRMRKFKKVLREKKLFPYKTYAECPPEKQTDFIYHLYRKIMRGEFSGKDFKIWVEATE
jgi:hypothetical protein